MLLSVNPVSGGIGASVLAWCISVVGSGGWALDLSGNGGLAWAAGAEDWPSWPRPVSGSGPPADLAAGLLAQAAKWQGVRLLSGGTPPRELLPAVLAALPAKDLVVCDGQLPRPPDVRVWLAPNTPRGLELLESAAPAATDVVVIGLRQGGVPLRAIRGQFGHALGYRWQRSVRLSVDLGYGVPKSAHVRKVAAEVLAECED